MVKQSERTTLPPRGAKHYTKAQQQALEKLARGSIVKVEEWREVASYRSLMDRGICEEVDFHTFRVTTEGMAAYSQFASRKGGRPPTFPSKWEAFVNFYGGRDGVTKLLHCHYMTLNRWALGKSKPTGPAQVLIADLAKKATLPNPLDA